MSEQEHQSEEERRNAEIESKWQQLSPEAQDAMDMLIRLDQRTGANQAYLDAMEISDAIIEELVKAGFVKIKNRKDIAEEFVNQHKAQASVLSERWRTDIKYEISDQDRGLLIRYDQEQDLIEDKALPPQPRYLVTQATQAFVKKHFNLKP